MGNCWRRILQCFCLFQQAEPSEKKPLLAEDEEEDHGSSVDPPTPVRPPSQSLDYGTSVDASDSRKSVSPVNEVLDSKDTTPLIPLQDDIITIDEEESIDLQSNVPVYQPGTHVTTTNASVESFHAKSALVLGKDEPMPPTTSPITVPPTAETSDSSELSLSSGSSSLLAEHDKKFSPFGEEWDKLILPGKTKSVKIKSPITNTKLYKRLASEPQLLPEKKDKEKEDETDSICSATPSKRQLTAMELLQTETTYIRNLKIIIEIYKLPLEKAIKDGDPILAPEDIRNIFGGISDILAVHAEIHQELSNVISDWQEDCCIAGIITKYQSQLTKIYPPYVNFFDMGKDTIFKQKKSNAKFLEFLTNCFNDPTCLKQPLDALLIRPVQRLPSMSLLISDLQRRTPEDIPDHKELEKAKESLKQVLSHINEDKRKTEGKMKIFDIIYEVESCPVEIVSAHRLFVARTNVTSLNEGLYRTGDKLALYLLTDMIEVSKFKRSSGNFLLKHIRMLPLTDIKLVIDINDSEKSDNMFAIQLVDEPSAKSNIHGTAYNNQNMDHLCVCQVMDDRTYKDNFLKKLREQMKANREKFSDEVVLKKMESTEVQPMLKRDGSRVFRRGRGKPKKD